MSDLGVPSINIHWRPLLSVVIVTQLVTLSLCDGRTVTGWLHARRTIKEGTIMPLANEDRLRDSLGEITRTVRDKGWQTMVKLSIYDNGIVGVNGVPLNPNPSQGMDVADERIPTALAVIVDEFKRQVEARSSRP